MGAEEEFAMLCNVVREHLGLSLESYRSRQLDRRLSFFMQRHKLAGMVELVTSLRRNAELRRQFADYLTINVSEFYRNPDRFTALQEKYLPILLQRQRSLHVWSAGCSIGAEIYTIAMMLAQLSQGVRHTLLATDIDRHSLERCRAGTYSASEVRPLPATMLRRYFTPAGDGFMLKPIIQQQVMFRHHDLLKEKFPAEQDLIVCRNVVIYFTSEVKAWLYRQFYASLRPGGILFIGATEGIFDAREIGLRYLEPCFYERPPN